MNPNNYKAPASSYFICMTPRTGSSHLCEMLKSTRYAGNPEEYYLGDSPQHLLSTYGVRSFGTVQHEIVHRGTTPNGIFGVKLSPGKGGLENVLSVLKDLYSKEVGRKDSDFPLKKLIEWGFPGLKCVFLTRRNKVRQAVSWWKAVQSNQWGLRNGEEKAPDQNLNYVFDAIDSLVQQAVLREAGWQAFFKAIAINPLTISYEDLVTQRSETIRQVLDHLGQAEVPIPPEQRTYLVQADSLSELWVEQYREEKQRGWTHIGWPASW